MKIFIVDRWVDHDDIEDCEKCEGTGEVMYDKPIVDYEEGGYIYTYADDCEECDGSGWIVNETK